jgi:hypothetical protein
MKRNNFVAFSLWSALLLLTMAVTVAAQSADQPNIANVAGGGSAIRWDIGVANAGGTLTITFPDGRSLRKSFKAGTSPDLNIGDKGFESPGDGVYTFELQLAPQISSALKATLTKARGRDDDPESERASRKPIATTSQSGSFAIVGGSIVTAGAVEADAGNGKPTIRGGSTNSGGAISGETIRRLKSHHFALFKPDFVIADDLIVQGSACVGLDCVDGENFGFDTIRMKENNTRLQYDDTSTSAGFASNNWQIRANSSASGGGNFLAFVDQGTTGNSETGTISFEVDAGAPANSLRVSSAGKVGIRTATPVLDVHANSTDTPAIRLEQNNSGGFTAQTWDIGANEANFFVRSVTTGSQLPFRIRPGAPTSSIDISASGNVGIGTASPDTRLSVLAAGTTFPTTYNIGDVATFVAPSDNFTSIALVKGGIANPQGLHFGVNQASLFSEIQASRDGVATNTLALNRQGGNVGIGTSSPDQKLSVSGDADKSAGGTSWGVFSDERLKDIKGSYSRGLSAVLGLQPVRFSYKKDNALNLQTDSENIGFSAQALQKLVPEAVTKSPSGYLVVHSDAVLWAMLNAIKEQQAEIQQLKGQIQKLRTVHRRRHR